MLLFFCSFFLSSVSLSCCFLAFCFLCSFSLLLFLSLSCSFSALSFPCLSLACCCLRWLVVACGLLVCPWSVTLVSVDLCLSLCSLVLDLYAVDFRLCSPKCYFWFVFTGVLEPPGPPSSRKFPGGSVRCQGPFPGGTVPRFRKSLDS